MELIIDANIFVSSLLRDQFTRKLILSDKSTLYAPEFLLVEVWKYLDEFSRRTKVERNELKEIILDLIFSGEIKLTTFSELNDFIDEAESISPDPKDVPYFALALKLNIPIWSNDKRLKEQNRVKVYSTQEIIKLI